MKRWCSWRLKQGGAPSDEEESATDKVSLNRRKAADFPFSSRARHVSTAPGLAKLHVSQKFPIKWGSFDEYDWDRTDADSTSDRNITLEPKLVLAPSNNHKD